MTTLTNTYTTPNAKGLREDLTDFIWNISPTMTPYISNIGKEKASGTCHEWQADSLAPVALNAQLEGDNISSYTPANATVRLGNYTQISYKTLSISGTLDAVNKAGRKTETAYQLTKRGKELKRDMEYNLLYNQAKSNGSPRVAAGAEAWYHTNTNLGAGATAGSGDGVTARVTGTQRALTEAMFKNVLQGIYNASAECPDIAIANAEQKQVISGFNGGRTVFIDNTKQKTLNTTFDVYESDFGDIKIIPTPSFYTNGVHLVNTDYWAVAELRPFQTITLAQTGDAQNRLLLAEYTLTSRNEASSGFIGDLT